MEQRPGRSRSALLGGGVPGNEELTAITGLVLIVLLAVLGVTIVRIGQLMWLHLFLGFLLLGPVVLKMGSTGYRFVRYYAGSRVYGERGAPTLVMRSLAPLVVISTAIVFISGIVLMLDGPLRRGTPLLVHKVSFIVWLVATALHVLGHVPGLSHSLQAVQLEGDGSAWAARDGEIGRWIVLAGALVGGAVIAVALLPHFSLWTAPGAFGHHDH